MWSVIQQILSFHYIITIVVRPLQGKIFTDAILYAWQHLVAYQE